MSDIKIKTAIQLRDELNRERNDKLHMPVTVIIEGNRHAVKFVRTVPAEDTANQLGDFQIWAGEGIGE